MEIILHKYRKFSIKGYFTFLMLLYFIIFFTPNFIMGQSLVKNNKITFSFFGETGETEDSFTIAGRNFPVKVGSLGLKATYQPSEGLSIYSRAGIGYSPKQTVSAFNFNVSGSVFAMSVGAGASREYRIRTSNFVVIPFIDYNLYNYSSDTFRGKRGDNQLKANVRGISSFVRSGIELRYLTTDGYLFFGTGLNKWNIENKVTIVEGGLTITPRLWADNTDTFSSGSYV